MKGQKYPNRGRKKLWLPGLIIFFTLLGFNSRSYSQGWSFQISLASSGCYGAPSVTLPTLPNNTFSTKGQCETMRNTILAIRESGGGCTVYYTCTSCVGSDIVIAGQTTPGEVTFEQGKPLFTPHESEAFQDWARDYKQQLESYGIESILGKNIIPNHLPNQGDKPNAVPSSGDKDVDQLYSNEVLSYEFPEQGGEVDLSHLGDKPGVVDPNDLKNNETESQGGAGLSEGEPLQLPKDLGPDELMDALKQIRDGATDPELRDLASNVIDLLNYLYSLPTYNPPVINNSNSELFNVTVSNAANVGNGTIPINNEGTAAASQNAPANTLVQNIDETIKTAGTVQTVVDLSTGIYEVASKTTLNAVFKGASGLVGSFTGGWSVGGDINDVYNDLTTNENLATTATDISKLARDGALLVGGIAIAAAGETVVVFGLPIAAGVLGVAFAGASIISTYEDYYVKNHFGNKK